jgi:predicted transcriptional regulator
MSSWKQQGCLSNAVPHHSTIHACCACTAASTGNANLQDRTAQLQAHKQQLLQRLLLQQQQLQHIAQANTHQDADASGPQTLKATSGSAVAPQTLPDAVQVLEHLQHASAAQQMQEATELVARFEAQLQQHLATAQHLGQPRATRTCGHTVQPADDEGARAGLHTPRGSRDNDLESGPGAVRQHRELGQAPHSKHITCSHEEPVLPTVDIVCERLPACILLDKVC